MSRYVHLHRGRVGGIAYLCLAVALLAGLSACSPWVVRPLNSETGQAQSGEQAFDAKTYVAGIWTSKVVPAVAQKAQDARTVLDAIQQDLPSAEAKYAYQEGSGRPYNFTVKGEGTVLAVDTSTLNGTLTLDIPPYDGKADLTTQIGPVMTGTAIRDGLGLIHYSEFTNQIDYAGVADELNNRVLQDVLSKLDVQSLTGKTVTFEGIFPLNPLDPSTRVMTPVKMSVKGGS